MNRLLKIFMKGRPPSIQDLALLPKENVLEAHTVTAKRVTQLTMTLLGFVSFCFLALFSPDSELLGPKSAIDVPFAGKVSFTGFMVLGPIVLIALRYYTDVFHDHWNKLELTLSESTETIVPIISHLKDYRLRVLSGFLLYYSVPLTLLAFAYKAAALPRWGAGILGVAGAATSWHVLVFLRLSYPSFKYRWILILLPIFISMLMITLFNDRMIRPMYLVRSDLSKQYLAWRNLDNADLQEANLKESNLSFSKLRDAALHSANLERADLQYADLTGAIVETANLKEANLYSANLEDTHLYGSDFRGAFLHSANLTSANLQDSNLEGADMTDANGLTCAQLAAAENWENAIGIDNLIDRCKKSLKIINILPNKANSSDAKSRAVD